MNTPYNKTFENYSHSSVTGSEDFTKTYSFDEAVKLFKNGWVDMSTKLTQKLNVVDKNLRSNRDQKNNFECTRLSSGSSALFERMPAKHG